MTNIVTADGRASARAGSEFSGTVVHGDARGRLLGFPTANVDLDDLSAPPADGVYVARVYVPRYTHGLTVSRLAALSVGTNPTFDGQELRFEAHLLDFDGDLYGRSVTVRILDYLRQHVRFDTVDSLVAQIADDVEAVRTWRW